ncbi:MAG: F0F1 ATP synthase subunit alpha, partial [Elusimicrobiota bacterium]
SDLFNAGIRPAINVGLSVSRVGGAAQSKSMKQIAGPLRLELAQFRELQAFTQFGSDLDEATTKKIERGKRLMELLKQPQYQPLTEVAQVISIFAATYGLLDDVPVEKIRDFEEKLIEFITLHKKEIADRLYSGAKMDETAIASLKQAIEEFKKGY